MSSVNIGAFPVTTDWDPDSVSWTSPWSLPGGDLVLPPKSASVEKIHEGRKRRMLGIDVYDVVRQLWKEEIPIYGFALSPPIAEDKFPSEEGFTPVEIGDIGLIESVTVEYSFTDPYPPAFVETPPTDSIEGDISSFPSPSEFKEKLVHHPPDKPTGPVMKDPDPPPPPPPPQPAAEKPAPDPPPPVKPAKEEVAPEESDGKSTTPAAGTKGKQRSHANAGER
jgi:hypothetical protein